MSEQSRAAAVAALRDSAGVLVRPDVLTVRVSGSDRIRFLNGMLSNDVEKLGIGEGQRAVKASAKGRVEGVLRVRRCELDVLLDLREVSAGRVAGELVKFIVMDDVSISDASSERQVVSIHGPESRAVLAKVGFQAIPERNLSFTTGDPTIIRDDEFGVEGYELHVGDAGRTLEALVAQGAVEVTFPDLDIVRVEAGRPLDGVDIDLDTIPMEARLEEAIDLDKGCFIGQEVIARATLRGGVKHRLVGLRFGDRLPPAGAELWPEGAERAAGELTSSVFSPTLKRFIGLGYLHIDHEAPGTRLEARWAESSVGAEVVGLPHIAST